ncbi:Uncharacterized conserved protein, contains Zn finger domain [Actinokineospora alba]|uniref:Uncharacterized conserved protein, contains Zn finger domain n=2 Tax=Actinokineospora alba TaxID=504798 RepID=A0A1H0UXF9_9PSEU|nr:putative Zn finger protein [Actinokineospora alba]SDI76927.1 Uncharacterized conserved protein, contains Zn finger domain [Actinokineospora alba]SDP70952.1 Uncharacterized conserved protein, contains Zn finger domain [Actinokineospora alba]
MIARGFPAFPPAKRRPGHFARTWWGRAWIKAMEDSALDEQQLRQGRKYAYTGYVGSITVSPGRLAATVRDYEDDTSYQTVMRLEPLSDAEWRRFLDQIAVKAGHIAALLDRDMPAELVDAAGDAGVRLLPDIGDLDPECSCPGWEMPCRHAAALAYQVSWLLDADPFVLLLLRGKDEAELLGDLHGRSAPPATELAVDVFARRQQALPEPPPIPDGKPTVLSVPPAEGVDPEALELLATDAATRAREMLTGDVPDLARRPDAIRYAATYPAAEARLRSVEGLDRAVAAWRNGGEQGLRVLETSWQPPAASRARADDALAAVAEGSVIASRNHWTVGEVQLRLGRDERWYPYRDQGGEWWPVAPPQADVAAALIAVLA